MLSGQLLRILYKEAIRLYAELLVVIIVIIIVLLKITTSSLLFCGYFPALLCDFISQPIRMFLSIKSYSCYVKLLDFIKKYFKFKGHSWRTALLKISNPSFKFCRDEVVSQFFINYHSNKVSVKLLPDETNAVETTPSVCLYFWQGSAPLDGN